LFGVWPTLGWTIIKKAIEQFTKAIQLDARLDIAYALRATAYTRIKKYDEALADLDTVRKITNNTELRENTEHLIQVTQNLRNAENELQRVQEELRQLEKTN
jgi:tetratricopeptide (TPR) repeat protein